MAISFLRLSKVSRKKFLSFSLEFFFLLFSAGEHESFLGHKKPFCVHQPLAPGVYVLVCLFGLSVCVCLSVYMCVCMIEGVSMCLAVCVFVCMLMAL